MNNTEKSNPAIVIQGNAEKILAEIGHITKSEIEELKLEMLSDKSFEDKILLLEPYKSPDFELLNPQIYNLFVQIARIVEIKTKQTTEHKQTPR
jgi:hypothetical protein